MLWLRKEFCNIQVPSVLKYICCILLCSLCESCKWTHKAVNVNYPQIDSNCRLCRTIAYLHASSAPWCTVGLLLAVVFLSCACGFVPHLLVAACVAVELYPCVLFSCSRCTNIGLCMCIVDDDTHWYTVHYTWFHLLCVLRDDCCCLATLTSANCLAEWCLDWFLSGKDHKRTLDADRSKSSCVWCSCLCFPCLSSV